MEEDALMDKTTEKLLNLIENHMKQDLSPSNRNLYLNARKVVEEDVKKVVPKLKMIKVASDIRRVT